VGCIPALDPSEHRLLYLGWNGVPLSRPSVDLRLPIVSCPDMFDMSEANFKSDTGKWSKAYVPYLIIFVTSYWTQLTIYWILGTFTNAMKDASRAGGVFRAFETAGQAVSYGLSSASNVDPAVPLYANCAILVLAIPSMVMLIGRMPKVPLSIDSAEEICKVSVVSSGTLKRK
jgi:hypothetical protein